MIIDEKLREQYKEWYRGKVDQWEELTDSDLENAFEAGANLADKIPTWISVEDFKDMPLGFYVVKYNTDIGVCLETDEWLGETFGFENFEREEWDSMTSKSIISAMPLPKKEGE